MLAKSNGLLPLVTPAKAGVQSRYTAGLFDVGPETSLSWIPAYAGMTESGSMLSNEIFGNPAIRRVTET